MTSRDFCFWLQGFFELRAATPAIETGLDGNQTQMIRRHLALVFEHEIDPSAGNQAHQFALNQLHSGQGLAYCAPEKQQEPAHTTPSWAQGPRPDGTQARC